jgi:hypothetical protein
LRLACVMIGCNFRKVSLSHWSKLRHQISPIHLTRGGLTIRRDPLSLPEIPFTPSHLCLSVGMRNKTCISCRLAKAKCSLSMPCSRCAKRHLECQYTSNQPSYQSRRMRLIKPAVDLFKTTDATSSSLASTGAVLFAVNVSEQKSRSFTPMDS